MKFRIHSSAFALLCAFSCTARGVYAVTLDDFVLTTQQSTIAFSEPSTVDVVFYPVVIPYAYTAPASATLNGVSGYTASGSFAAAASTPYPAAYVYLTAPGSSSTMAYSLYANSSSELAYLSAAPPYQGYPAAIEEFVPGTYMYGTPLLNSSGNYQYATATLSITAEAVTAMTPEPPSLLLLAPGLLTFGTAAGRLRRRLY